MQKKAKYGMNLSIQHHMYSNPSKDLREKDYYPFGMVMPERNFTSDNYRFGFNGKEKDDEIKGSGNQLDYGLRVYDSRIAKFLSVDPLTQSYPWYSSYQYAGNSPIQNIDLDGAEDWYYLNGKESGINGPFSVSVMNAKGLFSEQQFKNIQNLTVNPNLQYNKQNTSVIKPGDPCQSCAEARTKVNAELKRQQDLADQIYANPQDLGQPGTSFLISKGIIDGLAMEGMGQAVRYIRTGIKLAETFASGGTHVTTTELLAKHATSSTYGGSGGLFVAPTAEVDALIVKGASRAEIEVALGLEKGQLSGGQLVRIDIKNPNQFNLRLPTKGNESFIYGGKTSGGVSEGIINPVRKGSSEATETVLKDIK